MADVTLEVNGQPVIEPFEAHVMPTSTDSYLKINASYYKKGRLVQVTLGWTAMANLTAGTQYINTLGLPAKATPVSSCYVNNAVGAKLYTIYINTSGNVAFQPQEAGINSGYGASATFTFISKE